MKKKLICMLAIAIMVLAMGITVYGDEYSYNDNVEYLEINGINYNSKYETERIDGVTYDYINNTLTLENCNITVEDHFIYYDGCIPLHIVIKGNNTITGTKDTDGGYRYFCWSSPSYLEGTIDDSIYIEGTGTLNVNDFYYLVNRGTYDYLGILSIDGVTINTNGAGITSEYGDIIIENSKISMESSQLNYGFGITTGEYMEMESDDPNGNGKLTIQNSVVEMKTTYEISILNCKELNLINEYIYAGKSSAEYSYTTDELLKYDSFDKLSYSPWDINYILITTEKLNYPSISSKNNSTNNNSTNNNVNSGNTTNNSSNTVKVTKPGKVKSFKVKNVKGKKAKLTWKKMSGVKGFQIVYGLNKKCTKGKKTVTASASSKSKTIKKLKKKKTYYFKIRAYKVSNGSKVYGSWSAVKKVKIKK